MGVAGVQGRFSVVGGSGGSPLEKEALGMSLEVAVGWSRERTA